MSNQASPCHYCHTIAYLCWKTIDGLRWWIHCDGCGQISRVCETQSEAGESWNEQQALLETPGSHSPNTEVQEDDF